LNNLPAGTSTSLVGLWLCSGSPALFRIPDGGSGGSGGPGDPTVPAAWWRRHRSGWGSLFD